MNQENKVMDTLTVIGLLDGPTYYGISVDFYLQQLRESCYCPSVTRSLKSHFMGKSLDNEHLLEA